MEPSVAPGTEMLEAAFYACSKVLTRTKEGLCKDMIGHGQQSRVNNTKEKGRL